MIEPTRSGRGRGASSLATAALAALVALMVFAPLAKAGSSPLAGGSTTITLGKGFVKKLSKSGIKVVGVSPGAAKGAVVTIPVVSGSLETGNGQGTVVHSGGFKFKRGRTTVPIQDLILETATASLAGKLAGRQMKIATVEGFNSSRDGFGIDLSIGKLKLTAPAAKALAKKLTPPAKKPARKKGKRKPKAAASKAPPPLFKANLVLGAALSDTEPTTVTVSGTGMAQLLARQADKEPYSIAEVKPLMVAPGAYGPTVDEIPALTFPIGGGTVSPSGATGFVKTSGGVTFGQEPESGGQVGVKFLNWAVDFTNRTTSADVYVVSGEQEVEMQSTFISSGVVASLDMSEAQIVPDPGARTISVAGVRTVMSGETAAVMNSAYKKDAFEAGDSLGTYSFVMQTE